jgi:hypothetical protein
LALKILQSPSGFFRNLDDNVSVRAGFGLSLMLKIFPDICINITSENQSPFSIGIPRSSVRTPEIFHFGHENFGSFHPCFDENGRRTRRFFLTVYIENFYEHAHKLYV